MCNGLTEHLAATQQYTSVEESMHFELSSRMLVIPIQNWGQCSKMLVLSDFEGQLACLMDHT